MNGVFLREDYCDMIVAESAKEADHMKIKLSENIRTLRKEHAMTQEQLAEVLNVTVGAVYKWESGQSVPELGTIVELADLFDTSVDVLLGYEMKDNRLQTTIKRLEACRHEKNRDGLAEAEKALRKYPNVFAVVYGGAMLYWLFGIEDGEKAMLRRALELFENAKLLLSQNIDPKISESTICGNMADILLKLERTEEAVELMKSSNIGGLYDARIGLALAADSKQPEEAISFLSEALMSCVGSLVNTVVGYVNVYYLQKDYAGIREIAEWGIRTFSGVKDGDSPCFLDKVNGMLLVCLAYAQLQEDKNNTSVVRSTLRQAKELAQSFDAAPNSHASALRFVSENVPVGVYDDIGETGMAGIEKTVASLEEPKFSALWAEVAGE